MRMPASKVEAEAQMAVPKAELFRTVVGEDSDLRNLNAFIRGHAGQVVWDTCAVSSLPFVLVPHAGSAQMADSAASAPCAYVRCFGRCMGTGVASDIAENSYYQAHLNFCNASFMLSWPGAAWGDCVAMLSRSCTRNTSTSNRQESDSSG